MTWTTKAPDVPHADRVDGRDGRRPGMTIGVGAFYLCMAGINIGITLADPQAYRQFAAAGLFGFVRTGWTDIVMAHPAVWIGLLAVGELTLGITLLAAGRAARAAWIGVLAFHVLLLVFGWGFWTYAIPAGVALALMGRHDWPRLC